jgi:hypothetical protein
MTKHDLLLENWAFIFTRVVRHDFPGLSDSLVRQHCDAVATTLYAGLDSEQISQATGSLNAVIFEYSVAAL